MIDYELSDKSDEFYEISLEKKIKKKFDFL